MPQRDNYWYKLDNAAKLFPSVSTLTATNVFRLTARLFEDIDKDLLQRAVELALEEVPTFKVKIHKGFFWYYFEHNNNKPDVKEECTYPCRKIDKYTNNGYLFEVTYFEKNINLEIFHAVSDGTGGIAFLTKITEHYLSLAHPEEEFPTLSTEFIASDIAKSEDSFVRITKTENGNSRSVIRPQSYKIDSVLTSNNEIKVIKGIMSASKVRSLAKEKGVTITVFLTALLIYSIYLESYRYNPNNKSIDVCIPVNLRNFFKSDTSRNFFTSIAAGVNFYNKEFTLDEIISLVSEEFSKSLTKENLYSMVKFGVDIQNKMFLRFLPLFLKNIGLKYAFAKGEKGYSCVLSNLGKITLPKEYSAYVERFEVLVSPTLNNHFKTSVCSYEDTLVYSFTTNVESTDIQKRFFTTLVELGIDITISCNEYAMKKQKEDKDNNEQMQQL